MAIESVVFLPLAGVHTDTQSVIFDVAGALDPHREPARISGLAAALKAYSLRAKAVSVAKAGAALCLSVSDPAQWRLVQQAIVNFAKVTLRGDEVQAISLTDAPGGSLSKSILSDGEFIKMRHTFSPTGGDTALTALFEFLKGKGAASSGGKKLLMQHLAKCAESMGEMKKSLTKAAGHNPMDQDLANAAIHHGVASAHLSAASTLAATTDDSSDDTRPADGVTTAEEAIIGDTGMKSAAKSPYRDWDEKAAAVGMLKSAHARGRRTMGIGR
jgi:hypothetical protein